MSEFLTMGGYAAYVWPAYGISLAVLAAAIVWTMAARRAVERRLADFEAGK